MSQGVGCQLTRVVLVQNGLQSVTYREKRWTNSFLGLDNLHIVLVYVCERKQERVNIMWKGRLSETRGAQLADLSAQL